MKALVYQGPAKKALEERPLRPLWEGRQLRSLAIRLLLQGIPLARTDQHAAFGLSHQIEKQAAKLIRSLIRSGRRFGVLPGSKPSPNKVCASTLIEMRLVARP
jgi:hypothetical protein